MNITGWSDYEQIKRERDEAQAKVAEMRGLIYRMYHFEGDNPGCAFAGPGRGDCFHFIGLPGLKIPDQHDGPDDTKDVYGKPNGWCWSCWKDFRLSSLREKVRQLSRIEVKPEPHEHWEIQTQTPPALPFHYATLQAAKDANQGLKGTIYHVREVIE